MTTRVDEAGDVGAVEMEYHSAFTGQSLVLADFDRDGHLTRVKMVGGINRHG